MIKYAKIPNFQNIGEVPIVGTHLYQFVNTTQYHNPMIMIRAYDIETPLVWHGLLFINDLEYKNLPINDVDLTEVKSILGEYKVVEDFKDFIKGNMMEYYFESFKRLEDDVYNGNQ